MPNLTLYIPATQMPPESVLSAMTEQCTVLCTDILHAALKNVHIIYVGVCHGRGHLIYAEIQYRLEPFRTASVMDTFMEKLDDVIRSHTGLTARIRCFGYAAQAIHARN